MSSTNKANDVARCYPLGRMSQTILVAARDQLKDDIGELVEEFAEAREGDLNKLRDFANQLKSATETLEKVQQMLDMGVELGTVISG